MRVLVITVRGFHLGYLGCYGNEWIETPTLDQIAAEGVVFDQHHADRPDPAGARRAWRSGCYALPMPGADLPPAPPEHDLLALLRQSGVAASLVIDGSRPVPEEFAEGWERVVLVKPNGEEGTALECTLEAWQEALARLPAEGKWLLWLDLATLLPPWELPESFLTRYLVEPPEEDEEEEPGEEPEPVELLTDPEVGLVDPGDDETFIRLQRTYAAAVTYLDAGLALVRAELAERGLLDELLLVLTSDHGLPLGEHGVVGLHRPWLHDELIHVPLLIRFPGQAEAPRRVFALTQAVDLAPTLLDAFGLPLPPVHGHSLLPLARGQAAAVRPYTCAGMQIGDAVEWVLRSPEWGFVLPVRTAAGDPLRGPQLYVKPDDRWEVNNVVQHHLELAEHMEQVLRSFVAATRRPGPLQAPQWMTR
jgi:arylsulfatase A-like enzyme